MNQNQISFYCQVSLHIPGILFGILVHNNKHSENRMNMMNMSGIVNNQDLSDSVILLPLKTISGLDLL